MFNDINSWDEIMNDEELNGCTTKEEFIDSMLCYEEGDEEYEEDLKFWEDEWVRINNLYQEYIDNYYDDIGSKLDGEEENTSVCPRCGKEDEYENDDYCTGESYAYCSRCDHEYDVYVEQSDYYLGSFNVKTIRPKCKTRAEHVYKVVTTQEPYNFHHINFPYYKAEKQVCIMCGHENYNPIKEDGSHYSRKEIKRLQRKYQRGFGKLKVSNTARLLSRTWGREDHEVTLKFERDSVDNCLQTLNREFRKFISKSIVSEECVMKGEKRIPYDRIYKLTTKSGMTVELKWESDGLEIFLPKEKNYIQSKEKHRFEKLLKEFAESLGVKVSDETKKETRMDRLELPTKSSYDNYEYPLNGKRVAIRRKGEIEFVGIAHCYSSSEGSNNVYVVNESNTDWTRTFKSNIEEIKEGIVKRDCAEIRESRLKDRMQQAINDWDFEKATIIRDILYREGYKKKSS